MTAKHGYAIIRPTISHDIGLRPPSVLAVTKSCPGGPKRLSSPSRWLRERSSAEGKPYVSCLWPLSPLMLSLGAIPASAQPAAGYCTLLTKEDVEAALEVRLTNVRPSPLREIPSTQMRDQTCIFAAGSRVLRMTVTETLSPSQAQAMFDVDVMGHSMASGAKPAALAGIGDQAVIVASAVVLRKGKLVLDFLLADFANSDSERLGMAEALAAKAADKIR